MIAPKILNKYSLNSDLSEYSKNYHSYKRFGIVYSENSKENTE